MVSDVCSEVSVLTVSAEDSAEDSALDSETAEDSDTGAADSVPDVTAVVVAVVVPEDSGLPEPLSSSPCDEHFFVGILSDVK